MRRIGKWGKLMSGKSPSGALSPYYYKGGYFHGIHYGSYFDDAESLYKMIEKEEHFILESPERRRIMIDLYETSLTPEVLEAVMRHIGRLSPRIVKLSIAADRKSLRVLRCAMKKAGVLDDGRYYLCTDMEEGKTWLVSDHS